jgi:hypothetical protein
MTEVEGVVAAVSEEGVLGAPGGNVWVRLDSSEQTYLANVGFLAQGLRVGNPVRLSLVDGRLGQVVQNVTVIEGAAENAADTQESSLPARHIISDPLRDK